MEELDLDDYELDNLEEEYDEEVFLPYINWREPAESLLARFLFSSSQFGMNFKRILIYGSPGSGKTCTATSLTECIRDFYGDENTEILIYDPDNRIDPRYVCKNMDDYTATREEIEHRLKTCEKPVFIFQGSDIRQLLSQHQYSSRQNKREVQDFTEKFLSFRHCNDNIKHLYFIVGTQKFTWINPAVRDTFDLTIIKSASMGTVNQIANIYGFTRNQKDLLRTVTHHVCIERREEVALLIFPTTVKLIIFPPPKDILDIGKRKEIVVAHHQ